MEYDCTIDAKGLKSLEGHPDLKPDLASLKIENAEMLEALDGLENLTDLRSLELGRGDALQSVDGLANCTQLTSLDLRRCYRLQNVDVLADCTQLTSLNLYLCRSLQNVDGLANCTQLTSVDLGSCDALQNVDGLANCTKLPSLNLGWCRSLKNLGGLANCTQLTSLNLICCKSLQNVDGLANCTQLASLTLSSCDALQSVDGLANCTQLTSLDLRSCYALQNVDALANLTSLTSLDLSYCPLLPKSTLNSVADGCSVVGLKLDPTPLTCSGCGGDSFSGHYDGWYERVQWATEHGARPIRSNPGECEKSARAAWSSLVKKLNADQEWFEPDDEENTSVEAEASCVSCGEAIELPSDWFPSSSQARGVPDDVVRSWTLTALFDSSTGPVLHMPSADAMHGEARSPDSAEGTEPDGGMPCPCCSTGKVEVFGEAVFLSSEGGREGGRIKFERASTDDSRWTWESRLECLDAHSRADGTQKIPAKMGFRSGVGCSNDGCWEVRGLSRYADVPAAILAAGALGGVHHGLLMGALEKECGADLAALAADLEADGSKQTKLVKGALKWIGHAKGSKNQELSSESLRSLQRIAAELLDFVKA